MNRSFKKSISVNGFNYLLDSSNVSESDKSKIVPSLFENPEARQAYLLKDSIRTLSQLEECIKKVLGTSDALEVLMKDFTITDDLTIPTELRSVFLSNQKVAFFIGAGVSKLLGIPLWEDLAKEAIEFLFQNNCINHSEKQRLKGDGSTSKQILSILHKSLKADDALKEFYGNRLKKNYMPSLGNPYELILELEKALLRPALKISTNLDLEWETVLNAAEIANRAPASPSGGVSPKPIYFTSTQTSEFKRTQTPSSTILYKIHGTVDKPETAVITTKQYVDAYRRDDELKGFLEEIFKTHTVLFIGSSIQEFEILEHCLKNSPGMKHYALVGTQFGDENLFRLKKAYFTELNITPIPYYLDFQGFERLLILLRHWIDEISEGRGPGFYQDISIIDEVL